MRNTRQDLLNFLVLEKELEDLWKVQRQAEEAIKLRVGKRDEIVKVHGNTGATYEVVTSSGRVLLQANDKGEYPALKRIRLEWIGPTEGEVTDEKH